MYNNIPKFNGPFKYLLPEFIKFKRAMGYDYGAHVINQYKAMDNFFKEHNCTEIEITREMFELWTTTRSNERYTYRLRRISTIKVFSDYLLSIGYKSIYLDTKKHCYHSDFQPYIFSDEEIKTIYKNIEKLINSDGIKYKNFKIMFSLYYSCGLRLSEAINLKFKDINLDNGTIQILNSKNHISRLIVIHDSLKELFIDYYKNLNSYNSEDYVFQNIKNNNKINYHNVYSLFNEVLKISKIIKRTDLRSPTIHSLRHTFAVRSLEQMVSKGFDLYTSLPILSKYLGHKYITETEYYLRLVDSHYQDILGLNKKYCSEIFPNIGEDNE